MVKSVRKEQFAAFDPVHKPRDAGGYIVIQMERDRPLRYRLIATRMTSVQRGGLADRLRSVRMTIGPENLRSMHFQLTAQLCVQVLACSEATDQEEGLRTKICESSWKDHIKVITDIT